MNYTIEEVIEELRKNICGARAAMSYIRATDEDETPEYLNGYKQGLYDGFEAALGILELVEEKMEMEVL